MKMVDDIYEGKQVNKWLKCDIQAIKDYSNVEKLCPTAETKIMYNTIINRQKQIVESTQFLDDNSICLKWKTNIQMRAEELEVFQFKRIRKRISSSSYRSSEKVLCHSFTDDSV
jgi:hypothetical protein